jgi:hypothetical protein
MPVILNGVVPIQERSFRVAMVSRPICGVWISVHIKPRVRVDLLEFFIEPGIRVSEVDHDWGVGVAHRFDEERSSLISGQGRCL